MDVRDSSRIEAKPRDNRERICSGFVDHSLKIVVFVERPGASIAKYEATDRRCGQNLTSFRERRAASWKTSPLPDRSQNMTFESRVPRRDTQVTDTSGSDSRGGLDIDHEDRAPRRTFRRWRAGRGIFPSGTTRHTATRGWERENHGDRYEQRESCREEGIESWTGSKRNCKFEPSFTLFRRLKRKFLVHVD